MISIITIFIILNGILANLSLFYVKSPTVQNLYFFVHCFCFIILLVILNIRTPNDAHLLGLSYLVMFFGATFCTNSLPVGETFLTYFTSIRSESKNVAAEGVWQIVFVTFITYAMIPIHSWLAALYGFALALIHILVSICCTGHFSELFWQQVSCSRKKL